ncbi:MAG: TfoX/Sxy family DNA transformation protein [Candidatus Omnitrophica bacterium]|nr:TfoX/Sxy family DNA transformation protein [Candidatus Omnitrophota bacterium]
MDRETKQSKAIENLQSLINIGPATAKRFYSIGITTSKQLKKSNPEKIYEKLRINEGGILDKCVLYQIRGAILEIPWWVCKDISSTVIKKKQKKL